MAAATVAGLVFIFFFPALPESDLNYTDRNAAEGLLVVVMFFCGGFIGRRGLSADFLSDLAWPVAGSYVAVVFLSILASLSLGEIATMVALATTGILASTVISLVLLWRFPRRENAESSPL